MKDVRNVELRCIHVLAVFRFFGGIFLIVGLIIGLFGNLLKVDVMSTSIARAFPFISKLGPGIFAGVLFGVLYGLTAAAVSSIFALLYNFFAALLGGLTFDVKD